MMKKIIIVLSVLLFLCTQAFAHGGRTDKKGGHKCSQKSKDKGLCTGYHYHNGGSLHLNSTDEMITLNENGEVVLDKSIHNHTEDTNHDHQREHEHIESNS